MQSFIACLIVIHLQLISYFIYFEYTILNTIFHPVSQFPAGAVVKNFL